MDEFMPAAIEEAREGLADGCECTELMERFIREKPELWNEAIGG